MSETLPEDLVAMIKGPVERTAGANTPGWATEEEKMKTDVREMEGEDEIVASAPVEPCTLQWPGDTANQPGGMGKEDGSDLKLDRNEMDVAAEEASARSDCVSVRGGVSRTESEREIEVRVKEEADDGWVEKDAHELKESEAHLEIEVEDLNSMPEKAAGVFNPTPTVQHSTIPEPPRQSAARWEENTEKTSFLGPHGTPPDGYYTKNTDYDYDYSKNKQCCACAGTNRDMLKMGVSMFMSALIFPVLVWGGHTFLPFDAPLLDGAPLRLVYTLRCSVFAVVPIVLGILVLGVSRLRYGSLKPLKCDGDTDVEQVNVHRRYVDDSISLFLLYFLQLGVMAAYLNHNLLKLVPLLTIIFAFGRLVYWIAAAWGSSLRAFGFGFSFWPMLTMLVANLYFIFMADSAGSIFTPEEFGTSDSSPEHRQRFWG